MKKNNFYPFLVASVLIIVLFLIGIEPRYVIDPFVKTMLVFGYTDGVLLERAFNFFAESLPALVFQQNFFYLSLLILLITTCIYHFVNYSKYSIQFFFLAIFLFPVLNIFVPTVWIRRLIFVILIFPTIPRLWRFLNFGISILGGGNYYQSLLKFIAGIAIAILMIPGFYFPPFFDGIAGWVQKNDFPQSYNLTAIRIRFSDGSTAWFRPSFFNPMTMHDRPYRVITRRDPDFYNSKQFSTLLLNLYIQAYPALQVQKLPTEKILGHFAYKPHTLDKFDFREKYYPSDDIVAFELVTIINHEGIRSELLNKSWIIK